MKARITRKQARQCLSLSTGYCTIQYLLQYESPVFYTAWVYGRRADVYKVGSFYISTWYDVIWPRANYDTARKYDLKAEKIICSDLGRRQKQKKVNKLLNDFISECLKND